MLLRLVGATPWPVSRFVSGLSFAVSARRRGFHVSLTRVALEILFGAGPQYTDHWTWPPVLRPWLTRPKLDDEQQ
jgi:hypothetical protein